MRERSYDVVTVGGGIGGSTLGKVMAERGARVLVCERERHFTDRVRGELLHPWGVGEARALGIFDLLATTCGHTLPWSDLIFAGNRVVHRNLVETTPQVAPWFSFYHPAMQQVLLDAAERAGAEVRRGARVRGVTPGASPTVAIASEDGVVEEVRARIVVGVDGRTSVVRKWAGFESRRDPARLHFAGVLFDDMPAPDDTGHIFFNPSIGRMSLLFPQGGGRVRAYVSYHKDTDPPRGADGASIERFIAESVRAGVDPALYASARAAGPLATFDAADAWVEHPYRNGVALIGDAAATSDPTWGEGMSLALRDVHALSERLLASDDWNAAGDAYAEAHDRHYGVIHKVDNWFADFFMEIGDEADARRARALPLIAEDATRMPDAPFSGPEQPADDGVRRRFFGEE
jgi:2-polyprenyl-6-methoxyphenol hydroxylase-like FAD-dependent oxidoreductase